MQAVFVGLSAFERHRENYLGDEAFRDLQKQLMKDPEAGDPIPAACVNCGSPINGAARASAAGCG